MDIGKNLKLKNKTQKIVILRYKQILYSKPEDQIFVCFLFILLFFKTRTWILWLSRSTQQKGIENMDKYIKMLPNMKVITNPNWDLLDNLEKLRKKTWGSRNPRKNWERLHRNTAEIGYNT